ncbi:pentatricopeptide repeat-containing protein At2g13600-like [Gastrolobium bilobum]|uniref:pentatricopeptide repeat-containing protein At2g13600-like n=1 Tax=Gastrolobium bilobum TaxID=150636 RepID=UPI002AB2CD50|nr:pentatricopeptide repeat-containing protein At2g13600-like [Gastrolobium bilobum]XP_061354536.1 pentatricopeptide repeat-containing protein At2g13600-like [Gastrolobium bilobum]XP_061354537.1 pentatricopeptide repeat-containing protein At2g13600-like [Gastrolobium bilobum]XP_061354538.1 pentatricopeptide repeat-containing protein At2g13600-like [Gastrolobium bilobum]XP_061354539.1 pentatricopeptide repeat-containing protein At2g13600-like [Gastrolobium bilobum]XP_061354540.1 pentatricopepti
MATEEENYSNLLRVKVQDSNLLSGRAVHAKFIKGSIPLTLFLQNHLLIMYVKIGDLPCGLKLFEEMSERNVVSWSAVMAGCIQNACASKALSLFSRMHHEGLIKPNEFTFVSALQACSLVEYVTQAYQIYSLIVRSGFESNIFLLNAFLTVLVRHGKLAEALHVFETSPGKDIVSWNTMMGGYLQFSCEKIPGFWCCMNHKGIKPDNFTFASALTGMAALSYLEMGMQVHAHLVKSGYGDDICVGNSLADMYIKNHKLVEAFRAFDEMPNKDVCSWSQMAAGCLQCGEPRKALAVIAQMKKAGAKPNKFTLATALNACASLASIQEGKQVHGLRIKLGSDVDVCVDNALLDMYAKCGCMDSAWGLFRSMDSRSVISWTTMIMACAQNGQSREALQIFDEMRETSVEPNYITFICVLYACSQGGFVDEGWKYLSSMTKHYGIIPGEDHYACMVNILGRAGLIKEAEELILRMPFQPSTLIWQTLLSACQAHGDVETGKRAAEHGIRQDKEDPSTYLLLSNMFAELSNWDGVVILRELMETRDVKKVPGSSWIKIEKL